VQREGARVNTLPSPARAAPAAGLTQTREDLVAGRFRMLEPLGAGGHGTVWIARDERLRRTVAVKRVARAYGADSADRRRIGREALAAARLSHPSIVAFYEALSDDRAYYLVSELVEGASLADLYARSALTDRALMRIGVALADALHHAHSRGVVHRDVKPQNVIVASDPRATGAPAKLTDFGIAHITGEQPLTHSGDVIGTLAYMAPEQADGDAATAASDLYSLALTLYEGFAGANPLRAANPAATVRRLGSSMPSLARVRRDLPVRVCSGIDRALHPDPIRRGSVADLRSDLASALSGDRNRRRALGSAMRARPSALTPRGQRLVAGGAAAVLCVAALATVLGPHGPTTEATVATAAFGAVALAPRRGWLALALAGVAWIAIAGQPGTATVVALAVAPVPLLLAGEPWLWSIPAFAPLLGALGVAAAFPGVAARAAASSPWRRTVLGAVGYWWVALTEELVGRRLLFGVATGTRARASWQGSVPGALEHALAPLCTPDRIAPALLWALAALVLPWLVGAASRALRVTAAMAWAGGLIVASVALAQHIGAVPPPLPVAAGVIAALLATTFQGRRLRAPGAATVA
jgi:tRNA A-37 threonylcarbamoyl transferase component Bud32